MDKSRFCSTDMSVQCVRQTDSVEFTPKARPHRRFRRFNSEDIFSDMLSRSYDPDQFNNVIDARHKFISAENTPQGASTPTAQETHNKERRRSMPARPALLKGFNFGGLHETLEAIRNKSSPRRLSHDTTPIHIGDAEPSRVSVSGLKSPALEELPDGVFDFVDAMPFLIEATREFKEKVVAAVEPRFVKKKEMIIKKGDLGKAIFFVARGSVEVISDDGEVIYAELAEGSFFGEIAIMFDMPRTCSVRASTNCIILAITRDKFRSLLEEDPKLKDVVMTEARSRLLKFKSHLTKESENFGGEFEIPSIAESLKNIPLFENCDQKFLYQLALHIKPRLVQAGEIIISKGEIGREMFFLVRGMVKILDSETVALDVQASDNSNVDKILEAGAFFGEVALLYKVPRTSSVQALTSCDLLSVSKELFDTVLIEHPELGEQIQQAVCL
ncbi:uncharacterized protein TRIADDRAFT_55492 [Trichoplax adhaerens]|uniref:Cyclic nucleotide-binding domain-containing protein n=1 Tax=Trichoplax adhaerens TaxID=10228 RepID=B3RV15_TRIAD|nr:hypothetical protein TRIADDRAFT_55492 [Trichoplax adhaerens]EDV25418.1 hypothetical protein TRIADDRAFT_55492 [Trichoplax adhaerens]|eukprot:XP_002111451.1 hypothetical protein TRIADDRAFT_55492 [Trichoplax adhaerens]